MPGMAFVLTFFIRVSAGSLFLKDGSIVDGKTKDVSRTEQT
jgi:hypothetical protein